jgi:[NiFe] hydrogenase diaphorase moiety small subunit
MSTEQQGRASFTLDGRHIPFIPGQTIMDAALAAGFYIPHLCHKPGYAPHGSCRVCVVRANGRELSACTAPAKADMLVESETEDLRALRVAVLQMLFIEGNHVCPACEASGDCILQAVAYHCGMLTPRFPQRFPHRDVDASHPDMILDHNRCILCELCVRASRDHDRKRIFAVSGRGIDSRLIVDAPSGRLGDTAFSKDDAAARVCPVGALLSRQQGFRTPIGQRRFDRAPVSRIGDVAGGDDLGEPADELTQAAEAAEATA